MSEDFFEIYSFILKGMSNSELQKFINDKEIKLKGFSKITNNTLRNKVIQQLQNTTNSKKAYTFFVNEINITKLFTNPNIHFSSNTLKDLEELASGNNKTNEEIVGVYLITLLCTVGLTKTTEKYLIYKDDINFFLSKEISIENIIEKKVSIALVENKDKIIEKQKKEIIKLKNEKKEYIEDNTRVQKKLKDREVFFKEETKLLVIKQEELTLQNKESQKKIVNLNKKLSDALSIKKDLEKTIRVIESEYKKEIKEIEKSLNSQENIDSRIDLQQEKVEDYNRYTKKLDNKVTLDKKVEEIIKNKEENILIIGKSNGRLPDLPRNIEHLGSLEIEEIIKKVSDGSIDKLWILDFGVVSYYKKQLILRIGNQLTIEIITNFLELKNRIKESL